MPSQTTAHKVPQPLATDPVAQGDDTARSLAAYLEGLPITSTGSLASGWSGSVEVERAGLVTTVYLNVTKATYTVAETITGAGGVPVGSRPRKMLYCDATDPAGGQRRKFTIDTAGVVKVFGYADNALANGIVGQVTYVAVPA